MTAEAEINPRLQLLMLQSRALPREPGVYLMKNESGQVIYIGKARDLRSRVKTYFAGGDGRYQIEYLLRNVFQLETIVTQNEEQAFVLERDLINRHKPRYNIRLKDDKNFLNVRIDRNSEWPRIELVRKVQNDGALYFGPYTAGFQLKLLLDVIKQVVPLRTCTDTVLYNRQRPCLEYQIKRCAGPCCLAVDRRAYGDWIEQAIGILQGKTEKILARLHSEMENASNDLRFEEAGAIRDRIEILRSFGAAQARAPHRGESRDVFGFYREGGVVSLCIVNCRANRLTDSETYSLEGVGIGDEEMLEGVLGQYYGANREIPDEIVLPMELENGEIIRRSLAERRGSTFEIVVPVIGSKRRLLEIAVSNARQAYDSAVHGDAQNAALAEKMALKFRLRQIPRRIECVDISNLQGSDIVGAIVCFFDGKPDKERYKRYRLKDSGKPDDFASIHEVVTRRLRRGMMDEDLPDLLIIDGGVGQLGAAIRARDELGVSLDIVSIAKIREIGGGRSREKRRGREDLVTKKPERIFLPGESAPIELEASDPLTHLLQRIRDEVHRFVLSFHRLRRSKRVVGSVLDEIPGVGPERKRRLLRRFGSLTNLSAAPAGEIAKYGRMPLALAERLLAKISTK